MYKNKWQSKNSRFARVAD